MNGAKDYRQDQAQHAHRSCNDARVYSPGYHLEINQPLHNSHPQHSKAMNFDNRSVDSFQYFKHGDRFSIISENSSVHNRTEEDPRHQLMVRPREPLELPVPRFEIDENYVGDPIVPKGSGLPKVENSSALDLDTRIDFLIKSNALAGMHPIFSQLESEESSYDSDDPFNDSFVSKKKKRYNLPPPVEQVESFDDPEKPLSRPPSPFLSRATYLFWFNNAIELKKQAKAQEQALLEKAAKKLLQENASSQSKTNQIKNTGSQEGLILPKKVLDEVCSELKEIVKKEFIREVFEDAVVSMLEQWWESNCQKVSTNTVPFDVSLAESSCLNNIEKNNVTRVSMESLTNVIDEHQHVTTSPEALLQKIPDFKPKLGIPTKTTENQESNSKTRKEFCSNTVNPLTASIIEDIPRSSRVDREKLRNGNRVASENRDILHLNTTSTMNPPVSNESNTCLNFSRSSAVNYINARDDREKFEVVMNILNTILDSVPFTKTD